MEGCNNKVLSSAGGAGGPVAVARVHVARAPAGAGPAPLPAARTRRLGRTPVPPAPAASAIELTDCLTNPVELTDCLTNPVELTDCLTDPERRTRPSCGGSWRRAPAVGRFARPPAARVCCLGDARRMTGGAEGLVQAAEMAVSAGDPGDLRGHGVLCPGDQSGSTLREPGFGGAVQDGAARRFTRWLAHAGGCPPPTPCSAWRTPADCRACCPSVAACS